MKLKTIKVSLEINWNNYDCV